MEKPLVYIIIPVYNGERFIKKCLLSLCKQSYQNIHIIVVNDGSTDQTESICMFMQRKDSRIQIINQPNQGSICARNNGVKACPENSYIMFCDADDTMPASAVEKMLQYALQYNADLVCGKTRRVWNNIRVSSRKIPCFQISQPKIYTQQEIIEELYISCFGISNFPVSLSGKLYHTRFLHLLFEKSPIVSFMGEDLSITVQLLPYIQKLVIIPDIVYNYRVGGYTSRFLPKMLDDFLALYHLKKQLVQQHPMPQDAERLMAIELRNILHTWLISCCEAGKYTDTQLQSEITCVSQLPEAIEALKHPEVITYDPDGFRKMLIDCNYDELIPYLRSIQKRNCFKRTIKKIIYALG